MHSKISSAICFNLDKTKILLSSKWVKIIREIFCHNDHHQSKKLARPSKESNKQHHGFKKLYIYMLPNKLQVLYNERKIYRFNSLPKNANY